MASNNRDVQVALLSVALGGLLTVGGGVVGAYWQAYLTQNQMRVERRLDAIRTFSTACQRLFSLNSRMNDAIIFLLDISNAKKAAGGIDPRLEESAHQQITSLIADVADADVAWRVETDVSNALFGTQFQVQLLPPVDFPLGPLPFTAAEQKVVQEIIDRWMIEGSPKSAQRCAENTKLLISGLEP